MGFSFLSFSPPLPPVLEKQPFGMAQTWLDLRGMPGSLSGGPDSEAELGDFSLWGSLGHGISFPP